MPAPALAAPEPDERRWTPATVAVIVVLVIIAMCQADGERARPVFCPGSPWVLQGDFRPAWVLVYATDSTRVRSGPAPDDSVLLRPVPGSELRVRVVNEWTRVVGGDGEFGGWIATRTLRDAPYTRMELRALSRAHRQALRRELMDEMRADSGASGVRLHPSDAPDLRRLYAARKDAAQPLADSAQRAAFAGAPFALYADVEERADSVRLVLVAATRSPRPLTWTQVAMLPVHPAERDSAWEARGRLPVGFSHSAGAGQSEHVRFLALPADSLERMRAWRLVRSDSVQMRMHEPECASAYLVTRADRERLRRALRLYELSSAERL
ncbi:MAG TPA: hypothetical protein VF665_01950 [Longimicrobium sp.]|uniref:hypothetical protein n=1 Tax=Longimicrobium sp. TaxID=2029185 RepID=UPI002EDB7776